MTAPAEPKVVIQEKGQLVEIRVLLSTVDGHQLWRTFELSHAEFIEMLVKAAEFGAKILERER